MVEIHKDIGSVQEIIDRFEKAKAKRERWESQWRRAYRYSMPNKEIFDEAFVNGEQRNAQVYDETAVESVPKFATRLQSALIPPWSQWAKLVPGSFVNDDTSIELPAAFEGQFEADDAEGLLEEYTEKLFFWIHHSNFSSQALECFKEVSIANGSILIEPSDDPTKVFTCRAETISEIYLELGPDGSYETSFRCMKPKARNILRLWKGAKPTQQMQNCIKDKPEEEIELIEAIIFEPEGGDYHMVVIEPGEKAAIFYENKGPSNPRIAFAWSRVAGETYGRGPIIDVLPAILSLNKVWEYALINGGFKAAGMWTAASDGVWNPFNLKLKPGTVIPVHSNDRSNPSLAQLPVGGDLQYIDWMADNKQGVIQRALFSNPLGNVEDTPVRTLGENMARLQDMLNQAGASISLLETDFVERTLRRMNHLLVQAGKLPPLEIDGEVISLKFQSPIAQARDAQELSSLDTFYASVAPYGPEALVLNTSQKEVFKLAQKASGLPSDIIVEDDERQKQIDNTLQLVPQGGLGGAVDAG